MVVDYHHVACVCGDWMKIPIFKKKKNYLEDWDYFFSKLGKKSPKFHWEPGLIFLAGEHENKSLASVAWQ